MFGREYANHLDILLHSFSQMNNTYKRKLRKKINKDVFYERLKLYYVSLFGIPEIGFQLRSLYFKKTMEKFMLKKRIRSVLDAGCGIGANTFLSSKMFPKALITGGDIDKQKLDTCKILKSELHINKTRFEYFNLLSNKKRRKYDLIFTIDVLEHIKNYKAVLKNFYAVLNRKGYLFIHVPQPNQKRIFSSLKKWHHEDHAHEGIKKNVLINSLETLGFKIISTKETYGVFGKLAWETNHILLGKNFFLAGISFPILYFFVFLDSYWPNRNGLGIIVLAKKI